MAIFGAVFFTICATGIITKINSIQALRDYIAQFGNWAVFWFIAFCFLQVVVLPVPGSVTVAAGVALFGPFKCAVYSFIGIVAGSIVAFAIGRRISHTVDYVLTADVSRRYTVFCGGAVVDDVAVFSGNDNSYASNISSYDGLFDRFYSVQYMVGDTDMGNNSRLNCSFVLAGVQIFGQNRRFHKE